MFTDNLQMDMIMNGRASGEIGEMMGGQRFDPGLLRPFINNRGQNVVTIKTGKKVARKKDGDFIRNADGTERLFDETKTVKVADLINNGINNPVLNATALRKDEWIQLDRVVLKAARQRLRAWEDLRKANSFGGFNAMSKMVLEHETMSDPGEARVDMDGLSEDRSDAPKYQLEGLPLPITHSGFHFSQRKLSTSRNTGTPLDLSMSEAAGRRVAESVEKTTIGVSTGLTFGDSSEYGRAPTVFGYTNFPDRATKTDMTAPTGANGPTILTDWLALRDLLYQNNFYGPYMAYTSSDYDEFLDNLFSTSEPSAGTLRKRLLEIDGIQDIRRLDYLTDTFTVILVQMTSDVARAINGMPITTIQWPSNGGMQLNFKVMSIQVPQLRADYNSNSGIAHGTTA